MRYILGLCYAAVLAASGGQAVADDAEAAVELRDAIRCFPVKSIVNYMTRFDGLDDSRTDTLQANFKARMVIRDEGAYPDRVFLKSGDAETALVIAEDGRLQDFPPLAKAAPKDTEICVEDKARAGTPVDQPGASFSLPLSIELQNKSGTYKMAELVDGLKDGKAFYKKMVGGPLAMLVPKMTHLVISYDEDNVPLDIAVFKGDQLIDTPAVEAFSGAHVIRLKDLKNAGASHIKISGGAHNISPAPSIKTMKKFGFGDN